MDPLAVNRRWAPYFMSLQDDCRSGNWAPSIPLSKHSFFLCDNLQTPPQGVRQPALQSGVPVDDFTVFSRLSMRQGRSVLLKEIGTLGDVSLDAPKTVIITKVNYLLIIHIYSINYIVNSSTVFLVIIYFAHKNNIMLTLLYLLTIHSQKNIIVILL